MKGELVCGSGKRYGRDFDLPNSKTLYQNLKGLPKSGGRRSRLVSDLFNYEGATDGSCGVAGSDRDVSSHEPALAAIYSRACYSQSNAR